MQSPPVPECADGGRLTEIQNDRVISLLLGWRVRFLMRSKRILKGVHALNDVYKVLSEVISTTTSSSPSSSSPGTAVAALSTKVDPKDYANRNRLFDVICQLSGNQSKRNGATSGIDINIPYNDRVLVSHLIKEVLLLRAAFRRALFEDVVWRPFQSSSSNHHIKKEHLGNHSREGYWDFSASISAIFNTAAVNDYPPSSGFGSPQRKQNSYFPTASRSSSFRVAHQEQQQQQQQQQQQHVSGDDSDDSLNHKSSNTPHTSPAVAGPTGDLGRTQPVVRRASIPFQEFPRARSDISKGDDKLGTSLSETSDSVIQAQLASLRLQAMKKKLGVMAEGVDNDNGGDEENEKDRDRVGRLKRSAVIKRAPVLPSKTSVSAPAVAKSSSLIEPVRPDGCRACIQLTVLHADRLMPAKKGAAARDINGNIVADRKPCLQVTLLMPSSSGPSSKQNRRPKGPAKNNGNSVAYDSDDEEDDDASASRSRPEELKKTHYTHKEFDEVTLNPRWKDSSGKAGGCQFYLPLPCPKRVLLSEASLHVPLTTESISDFSFKNGSSSSSSSSSSSIAEGQSNNNSSTSDDRAIQERDGYHGRACRCLLDHWSQGVVVIRVVDGERFNEEIFMGEVTLRLSSFIVSQATGKKKETSGLEAVVNTGLLHEVSGTYPLSKAKASDRVSGSLTLHAYLHMPDAAYVEGIRASAMPWSAPHVQSSSVLPHRRHTVAARTAWAAGESSINHNTDSPAHQEMKGFNPNIDQAQESKDISEWEDGEDDVLELTFAPHSPKIAESPDRRLFKHRPPVFSFGENGPHGPDTKSKIRLRPTTADDIGAEGSSMQHVQSDLVGGSKQLGLNFNDDSDSEGEGCGEDRDEWDPSGLEQFSTTRSAPKGAASRSASSPNTLSCNRKSMLDGVSKCLNGLSVAQDGADCFLEKMQKQLDGRQSAKSLSRGGGGGGGGKLSPRRAKSDSNISITKASISDISYPDSSPQRILTSTPTRNKKERDREKEKENEKVKSDDNSKENEKEKDKETERNTEKEKDKSKEKAKESEKSKEKEKEKDIEINKDKGKEKEKEKDGGKEVGKYQVYKAVKVAAVSNFMSLSSAPVTTSPPPPAPASRFNADSPFKDVTDYYDDRKASRDDQRIEGEGDRDGGGDREGDDDESGSVDSSEMIVIASTGFTITTSSSGVGYMTSNPSTPPSVSAPVSISASHSLTPSNPSSQIPSSPPPSISIFASNRSSTESLPMVADQKEKEEVVMSEAWRKRNLEREKRSASVSPIRGCGGTSK